MNINLAKLMNSKGEKHHVSFIVDSVDLPDDLRLTKPVEVSLDLTYANHVIKVEGKFQVHLEGRCDRCLEKVNFLLDVPLEEKLIHESDLSYFEDWSEEKLEEEYRVLNNYDLDLNDIVLENIILSLPIKVLCSEECKGICSFCGKNLNKETCDCIKENIDPRLAILAKFKK